MKIFTYPDSQRPLNSFWFNRTDTLDHNEFNLVCTGILQTHRSRNPKYKDSSLVKHMVTMCFRSWIESNVCLVVRDDARAAFLNKDIKRRKFKYSTNAMRRVLKTFESLDLIKVVIGHKYHHKPEKCFSTYFYPTDSFCKTFKKEWQDLYTLGVPDVLEIKFGDESVPVTQEQLAENPKLEKRRNDLEDYNRFLSTFNFRYESKRNIYCWDKKNKVTTKKNVKSTRRLLPFLSSIYSGDLEHGGRLYARKIGNSEIYQSLSKEVRKTIKINGRSTVELDFSCLHLNMLYAAKDLQLTGDAYSFYPVRKLAKKAILVCLNSVDKETAIKAMIYDKKEDRYIMKKKRAVAIIDRALEFHSAIADLFFNTKRLGAKLQNQDSEIMMEILLNLRKRRIPALPVHDSLIVPKSFAKNVKKTMCSIYENMMGKKITVK